MQVSLDLCEVFIISSYRNRAHRCGLGIEALHRIYPGKSSRFHQDIATPRRAVFVKKIRNDQVRCKSHKVFPFSEVQIKPVALEHIHVHRIRPNSQHVRRTIGCYRSSCCRRRTAGQCSGAHQEWLRINLQDKLVVGGHVLW